MIWTEAHEAKAKAAAEKYRDAAWNRLTEVWRPLWACYEVSSECRVRGSRGLVQLHQTERGNIVRLHTPDGVKNFRVAELVADVFGEKDFRPPIGHGGRFKLTSDDVEWIRWLAHTGMKQQEIADLFGIGRVHLNGIINRHHWR